MLKIKELLDGGFKNFPVAVVGDIMLDHYISGDVSRISPEAPVPVLRVKSDRYTLGGAGNVVMNLRGLGLPVSIFGRIGTAQANEPDEAGEKALQLFRDSNTGVSGIWLGGMTTLKTRVLGDGRQQMIRIDREEHITPSEDEIQNVIDGIKKLMESGLKAVILSDYGKGVLSAAGSAHMCGEIIKNFKGKIPILIDPKGSDWERYRGASMVSPNLRELSEVSRLKIANDDAQVVEAGEAVRAKYNLDSLLVTRSEQGATLIGHGIHHERASAVDVFDVSGAGDTMLATVAAFIAAGAEPAESVRIANAAAQIVIGKVGTCAITAHELIKSVVSEQNKKTVSSEDAAAMIKTWQGSGEKVVFTNGCFDVFHAGHADSLDRAKELGNRLVVGLNSDVSVKLLKGDKRPINPEQARARVLASLSAVDCIVIFGEDTPEKLLSLLRPDVIAKGGDYTPDQVAGRQYAKEVVILPILEGYSSTNILKSIRRT